MPTALVSPEVVYPDTDGNRMADNTLHWEWIATLKNNIELLFETREDVFVAGDNLIYPIEGNNVRCLAPDVYVAFGRPKGYRGSYQVWKEGGIFPQVVFEVLSPNNTKREMEKKRKFYTTHGAEEYYILDPDRTRLAGFIRDGGDLVPVEDMVGWVSPRLGIRFGLGEDLEVYGPKDEKFLTFVELDQVRRQTVIRLARQTWKVEQEQMRAEKEKARAGKEKVRTEKETLRAEKETLRAEEAAQLAERERMRADHEKRLREAEQLAREAEQQRAEKLAAKLRELGIDPDA